MSEVDYSNTIFIVRPVGPDAVASLRSAHNSNRLKSFHFDDGISSTAKNADTRSRECTPHVSRPLELQLHLYFEPGPKDATQGFVFGTNEEDCDVQLLENPDPDPQKKYGISRRHFCVDFNWESGFLRLKNTSLTNGTGMTAPSVNDGHQQLAYNNMHMLHPLEQTKIHVGKLLFEISFPARGKHQRQYDRNWETFRTKHGKAKINRLGIQSTLEITPFVQRREGHRSFYLLHSEIGKGQHGVVYMANDPRTGELYAAKHLTSRTPGWDVKAYMEIAISHDIVHEHIVSFVDLIDDGGAPILVMEYMPLGNLAQVQEISREEMKNVLRQALQALAYLHDEKNITHRDIKPENILVQSRTPELFIKLCDFGLSTESSFLMTCCGTGLYTAAEIFSGPYTKSVDIWAMGVLGFQFIQGLPAPPENLDFNKWPQQWSKKWSRIIRHAVNRPRCDDQVVSAISLLKRMLEPKPMDRPSAKACLLHSWIQSAEPFLQPGLKQTGIGSKSAETISALPAEIWNPPTAMSYPTVPGVLRKRLRSSESISSSMQSSERGRKKLQVDECLGSNVRGLLVGQTNEHDYEHKITTSPGRTTRAPHDEYDPSSTLESAGGSLPRWQNTTEQTGPKEVSKRAESSSNQAIPASKCVSKVTEFDARHVQMNFNGQLVVMRKEDGFIDATQIITLARKSDTERKSILERIIVETKVEMLPATKEIPYPQSWINLKYGRTLCKYLGLEQKLQPLLEFGYGVQKYKTLRKRSTLL